MLRADDSAALEGRGCYTTARVAGGRVRFAERHARRLQRDAARLGVGRVEEAEVCRALAELGRAAFGAGEGIVRLQASCDRDGRVHLVGIPQGLGTDERCWEAIRAPFAHAGPTPYGGCKVSGNVIAALGRQAARAAGVQESLLFDGDERLVEGARSNLCVHTADGVLATPPLSRGAVAGIAREIAVERVAELVEDDVRACELASARELIAVNAVRGARSIVRLDGVTVGDGRPGPWAKRLDAALADA